MEGQSIEELLNVIELYKQALKFYAEENNYSEPVMVVYEGVGNEWSTKIKVDAGHQARFALEQGEKIDIFNKKMIEEYEDLVKSYEDNSPLLEHPNEELLKQIEKLKNLGK